MKLLQKQQRVSGVGSGEQLFIGITLLSTKPKVFSDPPIGTKVRAKAYEVLHRGGNCGPEGLILLPNLTQQQMVDWAVLPLTDKQSKYSMGHQGKRRKYFRRDVCT